MDRFVMFIAGFEFNILIIELFANSLQLVPSKTLTDNVQFSSLVVFMLGIEVAFEKFIILVLLMYQKVSLAVILSLSKSENPQNAINVPLVLLKKSVFVMLAEVTFGNLFVLLTVRFQFNEVVRFPSLICTDTL